MTLNAPRVVSGLALFCSLYAGNTLAADGFKPRFPLSGTLGGEIVAPLDNPGFFGSIVLTHVDINKLTDDSGNARQQAQAGTFSTPTAIAGAVRTASYKGTVDFSLKQKQTIANLVIGHLSEKLYADGRLSLVLNLPYTTTLDRNLTLSGPTPTLSTLSPALTSPPLPAGTAAVAQGQAQAGFATGYQAGLAAQSKGASGVVDGLGDAEITGAWVYRKDKLKAVAGVTLALPTGRYDKNSSLNIGNGNFYTVRPGLALAYTPSQAVTVGGRASLGINSRNKDNNIRSGNFGALDLAAAFRTSVGVFGPHVLHIQQYQDDDGGNLGPNRLRATGVGAFFTTLVPGLDAAVNLSYMNMISSRNSLAGSFFQVRMSKAF